jgi:hypothetical protein
MALLSRRAFALGLALGGLPLRGAAQAGSRSDELLEHEVKAAFVFKFGEFVDWPEHVYSGPSAPFTIVVLGADPVAEVLEELGRQRRINNRPVAVRRLQRAEAIPRAQIVFVGAGESDRLRAAADNLKAASALTVTETARPSQPSGIINFVVRDNRVRFEIDAEAADQSGLKISSKVLSLAVLVKGPR